MISVQLCKDTRSESQRALCVTFPGDYVGELLLSSAANLGVLVGKCGMQVGSAGIQESTVMFFLLARPNQASLQALVKQVSQVWGTETQLVLSVDDLEGFQDEVKREPVLPDLGLESRRTVELQRAKDWLEQRDLKQEIISDPSMIDVLSMQWAEDSRSPN